MPEAGGKLRVLQVHNRYSPGWGGEDTVVELDARLLRDRGHAVDEVKASTASLKNATAFRQMMAAPGFLWSRKSYGILRQKISEFQPDVVHVHNTFPKLSPSVFWASHRAGVPVVQTLHNFRQVCANALLLREGRPCEKCVGRASFPALRHRCYGNSFARTAVVAAIHALHSMLGTYTRAVDAYITLNDCTREVFLRGGLPGHKLAVKANFVPLSSLGHGHRKAQVVFAGNLSRSKGVELLLEAWGIAAVEGFNLLLVGDGPERKALEREYAQLPRVAWCGQLSRSEVLEHIAASRILVFPSLAYEGCPMVLLEALSVATPVVVANHPGLKTIVRHQREGLMFEAGDSRALAMALRDALLAPGDTWSGWSSAARRTQAERYSEDVSYGQLISIYRSVIQNKSAPVSEIEVVTTCSR
jgi:glycosyltransferase involved in cell wall biosynthesis